MIGSDESDFDVIVIGGGVAGMTAAALTSSEGAKTLVVERHTVAGGCASFYQRKRYRFDVGATLVGGFGARGAHTAVFRRLGVDLEPSRMEPAMVVHLPDARIIRYGDHRWESERLSVFGSEAEPFWTAQERIADAAWEFSRHFPALPVDRASIVADLRALRPAHVRLLFALGKSVAHLYPAGASRRLRTFVDAQLIITAQAGAEDVDLSYGSTALDLAREGTFHLPGGVGTIATALARSARKNGAVIAYGSSVHAVTTRGRRVRGVRLQDGRELRARRVISAVPIFDLIALCDALGPSRAAVRSRSFPQRWGAFTVYCGVPDGVVPEDVELHHQLVAEYDRPLGECNSTFLSFSTPGDRSRAPAGGRAITISTHTDVSRWERAARSGTLSALRATYERSLLDALDRVVPGASERADVIENATPLTFERYTGRTRGLVGGLPQTRELANLNALSHRTALRGLYICGDTTFPGQSTVGATLSAAAAARAALAARLA